MQWLIRVRDKKVGLYIESASCLLITPDDFRLRKSNIESGERI
jgi:hypothetical protein